MWLQNYPLVISYIAIENGPVEIVDFPIKNGGSFHSFWYRLPEGNQNVDIPKISQDMMEIERENYGTKADLMVEKNHIPYYPLVN